MNERTNTNPNHKIGYIFVVRFCRRSTQAIEANRRSTIVGAANLFLLNGLLAFNVE